MPQTKTTDIAADLRTFFAKKLLGQAKTQTVLDQFGHREDIPAGNSKTIQFTQYADLAIVTSPLTEGVTPAGSKLSNQAITAVCDQLGDYVELTDLAQLTPVHPVVTKALSLLGNQAAKSLDRQIWSTLSAGTAVSYAGKRATRDALVAGDKMTMKDIRRAVTSLRTSGAYEFSSVDTRGKKGEIEQKAGDGNFVCILDPQVESDLMDDPQFEKAATAQAAKEKANELYTGTIVKFAGVTFVRTNNLTTVKNAGGLDVHQAVVLGMDAYSNTDLQKLETYKEGPGGVTDPLRQKMTIGWKAAAKSAILNNNWMRRIESITDY